MQSGASNPLRRVINPQLEQRHHLHQLAGLRFQTAGGRCHLFHQRRILLRHLVHLGDGFTDLVNFPFTTKAELRELSRMAGLETWDRPASACLSSRIPYGTAVTKENVRTVEVGEEAIRALGFSQFRVRFHEKLVRVEIDPAELHLALSVGMAQALVKIFKPLGFHYVTLDLEGYRQGSGNEVFRGHSA